MGGREWEWEWSGREGSRRRMQVSQSVAVSQCPSVTVALTESMNVEREAASSLLTATFSHSTMLCHVVRCRHLSIVMCFVGLSGPLNNL